MDAGIQHSDTQRRKRKRKGFKNFRDRTGLDDLPDDVIITILSCMSRNEAARTSVLSRRWRYLWRLSSWTLEFDDRHMFQSIDYNDVDFHSIMNINRKKFKTWVNHALDLHKGLRLDGLIIRYTHFSRSRLRDQPSNVHRWIYFAMKKQLSTFELNMSINGWLHPYYIFPSLDELLSRSRGVSFGFGSLKSLRLVDVDIQDEVVQYFLASCPYLEQLCIRASHVMKSIKIVDPLPNLKVLEISKCNGIQSLEVSAVNLVSCTYEGNLISPFKKVPSLSELTLGGIVCHSFICEPKRRSSYSVQLVKLTLNVDERVDFQHYMIFTLKLPRLYNLKRLELNIKAKIGRRLHFFISLIKASPLLKEFRMKISYMVEFPSDKICGFPETRPKLTASCYRCRHKYLKAFEMSGYVGQSSDNKFVLQLLKFAPSLETVTIDTESEYYEQKPWGCACSSKCTCGSKWPGPVRTRVEAKKRAQSLIFNFPSKTSLVVK